jgi:hypothetical protein
VLADATAPRPRDGGVVKYGFEWTPALFLLGTVIILPLAPPFALIGLVVVALLAVTALVALAGVIVATPYLLVRSLHRRLEEQHQSTLRKSLNPPGPASRPRQA